jgi:hypothetical protein
MVCFGGWFRIHDHAAAGLPAACQNAWRSTTWFFGQRIGGRRKTWPTLGSPSSFLEPLGRRIDASSFAESAAASLLASRRAAVTAWAPAVTSTNKSPAKQIERNLKSPPSSVPRQRIHQAAERGSQRTRPFDNPRAGPVRGASLSRFSCAPARSYTPPSAWLRADCSFDRFATQRTDRRAGRSPGARRFRS